MVTLILLDILIKASGDIELNVKIDTRSGAREVN